MKYFNRIIFTFMCVFLINGPVWAEETASAGVNAKIKAEKRVPEVFRKAFDGDSRAYKLDESYVIFNNMISAVLEEYYYERKKIFNFLKPAFILGPKNLRKSYQAYEASVIKKDQVYNDVKKIFENDGGSLEGALVGFNEEERVRAQAMWGLLKEDTAERVREFFGLENKFLERYKTHVEYLQDRVGAYSYKDGSIVFREFSERQYYSRSTETLKKISDKQFKVLLQQNIIAR